MVQFGDRTIDLTPPWPRVTLSDLISERLGVTMDPTMPLADARRVLDGLDVHWDDAWMGWTGRCNLGTWLLMVWFRCWQICHPKYETTTNPLCAVVTWHLGLIDYFTAYIQRRNDSNVSHSTQNGEKVYCMRNNAK